MSATEQKRGDGPLVTSKPVEIQVPHAGISLREFMPADAHEIFELIDRNRVHLAQFGEATPSRYPTEAAVLESILHPSNPLRLRLAIRDNAGIFMGSINLTSIPSRVNPEKMTGGVIGYYLGEEFTGHGYMTVAVEAVCGYAYGQGLMRLYAQVHPGNNPSLGVMARTEFKEFSRSEDAVLFVRENPQSRLANP